MITALGPRLGLGLRLDFGSQVWFVQYFSEKKVIVSPEQLPLGTAPEIMNTFFTHLGFSLDHEAGLYRLLEKAGEARPA